jgi:hypothetical protein
MAGTGRAERLFRVSPFHHCASVPPAKGMRIQAFVPCFRDREPVVAVCSRKKWADLMCVFGRAVEQLLVVYYVCEQHEQRVERELQRRQREQQRQDEHELCVAGSRRRMMASSPLIHPPYPNPQCCPVTEMTTGPSFGQVLRV